MAMPFNTQAIIWRNARYSGCWLNLDRIFVIHMKKCHAYMRWRFWCYCHVMWATSCQIKQHPIKTMITLWLFTDGPNLNASPTKLWSYFVLTHPHHNSLCFLCAPAWWHIGKVCQPLNNSCEFYLIEASWNNNKKKKRKPENIGVD